MKIGVIGLGRMGSAVAYRAQHGGHTVIGFDADDNMAQKTAQEINIGIASTLPEIIQQASIIWLMVPAGHTVDNIINQLVPHASAETIIIDGGNSFYKDSIRRAHMLAEKNIHFLDCGTSGGLHGKEIGFSVMIGGEQKIFERCESLFKAIAAPEGYAYLGPAGVGHYVKMIHNGIEYALLQAYAEGLNVLKHGAYTELNLEKVAHVWNHGSIIRSWILQLTENILKRDQEFLTISGEIAESGTGQWAVQEAQDHHISVDLIERALAIRAESRLHGGDYAAKLVALLRHEFGGHAYKKQQ